MINRVYADFKRLKENKRFEPMFDTALFVLITLTIHFLYNFWAISLHYKVFGFQLLTPAVFDWSTSHVFKHTKIVVDVILENETIKRTFYFANQCSVSIVSSCSGIKQILQFGLLILVYPGQLKHKAWFIPLGMFIIHLTNIFRLSGLCVVMANWPAHWHFAHDYPFRIVFYIIIFFLWVIWNDHFYHRKS